jgi:6-phosphogluconolactonase/glucosamine-6-phosphate isomerase/deaminase
VSTNESKGGKKHIAIYVSDVSEEHTASIFRNEEKTKQEISRRQTKLLLSLLFNVPPKRRTFFELQRITAQKNLFFVITAPKTSALMLNFLSSQIS